MMWYSYGYCVPCRELVGVSTLEHAEDAHDCSHTNLPRITKVQGEKYVATYNDPCIGNCDFAYLHGHEMCVDCGAIAVPRAVADPLEDERQA